MNTIRHHKYRRYLSIFLTALMMLTTVIAAVPMNAFASGTPYVTGLNVSTDNPTICATADYNVTFTVSDIVYDEELYGGADTKINLNLYNYSDEFDLSGLDESDFSLTKSDGASIANKVTWDSSSKQLIIEPMDSINDGTELTVTIPGVKNPDYVGNNKQFVQVYLTDQAGNSVTSPMYGRVNITAPKLIIEPEYNSMEVYLRNKLTITLKDEKGNTLIAPSDVNGNLYGGEFYAKPSDVTNYNYFTIPTGESSTTVYYRPTYTGTLQVYTNSIYYRGGYIQTTPCNIEVTPAAMVRAYLYINSASLTAGEKGRIDVSLSSQDQYYNGITLENDVTVDIIGLQNDGSPVEGKFYAAGENNAAKDNLLSNNQVTIKAGESSASFYYYDERATDNDYSVNIKASAEGFGETDCTVAVNAADAKKLVVTAEDGDTKTSSEKFTLAASLVDQYGNLADPQPPELTVQLHSSSTTGQFYSDQYLNNPISQLTFRYADVKTFYYKDQTVANNVEITSTAPYIETSDKVLLNITGTPILSISPEYSKIEIYLNNKTTISLKDKDGNPYVAVEDIPIRLNTDNSGDFYKYQSNNNTYIRYYEDVIIPQGQSSVDIYYRGEVVGEHNLSVSSTMFGNINATAAVEITPAGSVQSGIDINTYPMVAGTPGKVDISISDQYGNPVNQATDLEVALQALKDDGSPADGKFYAADADGNPVTATEITSVTIAAGESGTSFFYKDNRATTDEYNIYITASAGNLQDAQEYVTIDPDRASKVELTATDGETKTTNEYFTITAQLKDQYDNLANRQQEPLTVNLTANSESGKFYSDSSLNNPITQLTFDRYTYSDAATFYFKDDQAGSVAVTADDPNLDAGTVNLTVVNPPVIEFALSQDPADADNKIEINLNQKVAISLKNSDGTDYLAPYDIPFTLIDEGKGSFYADQANNSYALYTVTIPEGSSSVTFYYRPTVVGNQVMKADTPAFGWMTVDSAEFEVTPAAQVQYALNVNYQTFTAGVPGKIDIAIEDQYGNDVRQNSDLGVALKAVTAEKQADGTPVLADGAFYGANADGSPTQSVIESVYIPAGSSGASFYYKDNRATNDSDYRVFINATAGNLEEYLVPVTINPATASQVVVKAIDGNAKAIHNKFELEVQLLDEFGNKANPQTESLTVDLESSSPTGKFYGDKQLTERISQVTFPQDWWTQDGGQSKTLYYYDNEPAEGVIIKAFDENLTAVSETIDVLPLPKAIGVSSNESDWLIHRRGQVTVTLYADDEKTSLYNVPAKMVDGLDVALSSNPAGVYYTSLVGGDILADNIINVPAGAGSIELYFEPASAGDIQMAAGISYSGNTNIGMGKGADIVWVLDNSGSMSDDQMSIANNINTFANQLANSQVAYNLGFLYYEGYSNNQYTFNNGSKFTTNPSEFSQALIAVSQYTSGGTETTMSAVQSALSYPFTGAAKYIIVVTDEQGDDNTLYNSTLSAANAENARVYSIWDFSLAPYSYIDELVAGTDGIQIPLSGDWSTSLETLATDIISHTGSNATIQGTLDVNSSAAGGVRAVFDSELQFAVGQMNEVKIQIVDQYSNPVKAGAVDVGLCTKTDDGTESTTGHFYKENSVDASTGLPTGSPVSQITVPEGNDSVTVYYFDTRITANDDQLTGEKYVLFLGTKSKAVDGVLEQAFINPGDSDKLLVKVMDHDYYNNDFLNIDNLGYDQWTIPGKNVEQHKLLSGMTFPLVVSINDQINNNVPQSTPLVVNLSTISADTNNPVYGKFYLDYACSNPVTQVTIGAGQSETILYYVAEGTGSAKIRAEVADLTTGEFDIQVQAADRLAICFPTYYDWDEETGEYIETLVEDRWVAPEGRTPFYVYLTDDQGHPAIAESDVTITLASTTNGSFHETYEDYKTITSYTIPAGYHGVKLYIQGNGADGEEITISASDSVASYQAVQNIVVKIEQYPYTYKPLLRGWNTLSTPVQLRVGTLDDLIKDADQVIELAYGYDEVNKKWLNIYNDGNGKWRVRVGELSSENDPEFTLMPMEGIYLKLKGDAKATFYPYNGVSGPYSRNLVEGWNLMGACIDDYTYYMGVGKVLSNISGQYNQVVSPGLGIQEPWVHVYSYNWEEQYQMLIGNGYWVYMNEDATLAASNSGTPVSQYYGYYDIYDNSNSSSGKLALSPGSQNISTPLLPAVFKGTVKNAAGENIASGVVKAYIKGQECGSAEIKDGKFGDAMASLLIVQYPYNQREEIHFLINGMQACQTVYWPTGSDSISNLDLVVADGTVPELLSAKLDDTKKVVTLNFSEELENNTSDINALKNAVTIASDGNNFVALDASDTVQISGTQLIITFINALTGDNNVVQIAANTLKNNAGNVQAEVLRTDPITVADNAPPEYKSATLSDDKKVITVEFDENIISSNGEANLKAAVTYSLDDNAFTALGTNDTANISENKLVIAFATPLAGSVVRVHIAENAVQDEEGKVQDQAITTEVLTIEDIRCFIATAAYGSYLDPHVNALRNFRDEFLLKYSWGQALVAFYYKNSPPVANYIAKHEYLRTIVRVVLTPVVFAAEYPGIAVVMIVFGITVVVLRRNRRKIVIG